MMTSAAQQFLDEVCHVWHVQSMNVCLITLFSQLEKFDVQILIDSIESYSFLRLKR
jgi:hypothetical protein